MIWLAIYAAGFVIGLLVYGAVDDIGQDDAFAVFLALIWPLVLPVAIVIFIGVCFVSLGRGTARRLGL